MYHLMKCTDSDVLLVLSRSQYVNENSKFSLQSFSSKQILLVQHSFQFVIGNQFLHISLELYIYLKPFSLFLFLVKYSVWNLLVELAHMQFPMQDHYIHTSRHRKATIRSKWTFFCGSSFITVYECLLLVTFSITFILNLISFRDILWKKLPVFIRFYAKFAFTFTDSLNTFPNVDICHSL